MTLYDKIKSLYPTVDEGDFHRRIVMVDITNSAFPIPDGAVRVGSVYIESWTHPTLAQPTQAQLDAIGE